MDIDWEQSEQPSAPVEKFVRAGTHECMVVEAKEAKTKGGHGKIALTLRVESGPDRGLHIWHDLNVGIANARYRSEAVQMLRQLAVVTNTEIGNPFNPGVLVGKRCKAETYLREYDGKLKSSVKLFAESDLLDVMDEGDHESVDMPF